MVAMPSRPSREQVLGTVLFEAGFAHPLPSLMVCGWEAATMTRDRRGRKSNRPKTKLGFPDLEHAKAAVNMPGYKITTTAAR
jgi:hypothetical protein